MVDKEVLLVLNKRMHCLLHDKMGFEKERDREREKLD